MSALVSEQATSAVRGAEQPSDEATVPTSRIADLATACSGLLANWVDKAVPGSDAQEQSLSVSFRFNLWAQNNAAFSYGVESMDQRLRKARMAHGVITDLLEDLDSRLKSIGEWP